MSTDPQPADSQPYDPRIDSLQARSSLIGYASSCLWKHDELKHVTDRALLIEVRDCVQVFVDKLTARIAELPADAA